jgi:hypothetical protein
MIEMERRSPHRRDSNECHDRAEAVLGVPMMTIWRKEERRSPTRQVLKIGPKRAGSEIGAP